MQLSIGFNLSSTSARMRSWRTISRRFIRRSFQSRSFTTKEGYKSLGSFHSENLQNLLSVPDSEYTPPTLPFEDAPIQTIAEHHDYKKDFSIDFENWTFLNHGAFGAALNVGSQRAAQWRQYAEQQPLRYFDRDLLPHLAHTAHCMAQFLNIPIQSHHVLALPNVTAGMNAVLSGHSRHFGSKFAYCLLWDTTYGAVKKMAQQYYSINVTEIPLQSPRYLDRLSNSATPDEIFVEALDDCLTENPHLQGGHVCFILDHITSNTALAMPIERLARLLKERLPRCLVVVDGAHGLWMHDLQLSQYFDSGVDMYLTNGHKWFSAPKGIAFMMLPKSNLLAAGIVSRPAIVSHGMDQPDLFSRYVWDGCRDYAAALSVPAVAQYWQEQDIAAQRASCRDVLRRGVERLTEAWESDSPLLVDLDSTVGSALMTLVPLPSSLRLEEDDPHTSAHAKMVQDYLFLERVEVPIKCINGVLYARVSCHVYNTMDDFENLAQSILKVPYQ